MEQNLNLSLGQKLAMTAKLQQAIRILQLSAQDLRSTIESEFLDNPALEMEYANTSTESTDKQQGSYTFDEIGALAKYLDDNKQKTSISHDDENQQSFESFAVMPKTLGQVLEEQVDLTFSRPDLNKIAKYIIGSLDETGYLKCSLTELAQELQCSILQVESVLSVIQTFEPDGVGARDLRECLAIQAEHLGIYNGLIASIIDNYLTDVANSHYKNIAEKEKCTPSDVQAAVDIIRKLNPKPGMSYGADHPEYIIPDVVVRKIGEDYVVLVNDCGIPRLNISVAYKNGGAYDNTTKKYIEGKVNAAAWLIKSIEQRRNTLFNVVTEIVRQQHDFFEKGPDHLRPMLMRDVAENINVHESTVSRSVANKYVETPHGTVNLKKFFTANLNMNGEELVASQVKAMLKKFIENEDPQKPLSDQHLSDMLKDHDMNISRRTVMKYREQLGFLSSVKRKRY